jgi:hypothetical protein
MPVYRVAADAQANHFARLFDPIVNDTGVYLPIAFAQAPNGQNPSFAVQVPVQVIIQVEGAFFGALGGGGGGGGYTLAPFDFKAQVNTGEGQ